MTFIEGLAAVLALGACVSEFLLGSCPQTKVLPGCQHGYVGIKPDVRCMADWPDFQVLDLCAQLRGKVRSFLSLSLKSHVFQPDPPEDQGFNRRCKRNGHSTHVPDPDTAEHGASFQKQGLE